MKLYTFWLPFVGFNGFYKKVDKVSSIQTHSKDEDSYSILLDSTGFFYIQTDKKFQEISQDIVKNFINKQTKKLLFDTLLNSNIMCQESNNKNSNDQDKDLCEFIEYICMEIDTLGKLNLNLFAYTLDDTTNYKYKFELLDNSNLNNIINRNFEQLVKKSLFFTKGLTFDENEVYNLNIFEEKQINDIAQKCKKSYTR